MKRFISLLTVGALLSSMLIGCSSGGSASSATNNKLIVGTNAVFPPFEYAGADGEPDGFDIALIKAMGEKMGKEVEVQNMEFDSLVAAIGNKIDIAIAGMTVTEERKQSVDFSDTYYEAVQNVILPIDSTIATADDIAGKKIGVQLGTTGDFIAADISPDGVKQYSKGLDAVNDLMNGRLDCVIIDSNPAQVYASRYPDKLKAVEGSQFNFEPESYAIALPKGNEELKKAINDALKAVKDDGTFDKLVSQYIEEAEPEAKDSDKDDDAEDSDDKEEEKNDSDDKESEKDD